MGPSGPTFSFLPGRYVKEIGRIRNALLLLLLTTSFCFAAGSESNSQNSELAIWGGHSFHNGHVFGFDQDSSLTLAGASYARPFFHFRSFALKYRADIIPYARLNEPARFTASGHAATSLRRSITGGGVAPVGIQLEVPRFWRLQPVFHSTGGFLYFKDRVLSPRASQFNFTIDLGSDLRFITSRHSALTVGYMYHHLSNANIANSNPGVDSQMVIFGVELFR